MGNEGRVAVGSGTVWNVTQGVRIGRAMREELVAIRNHVTIVAMLCTRSVEILIVLGYDAV